VSIATARPGALAAEPFVIESYLRPGDERSLADDVLDGLTRPFKELPPKHFYDGRGAELFDRICELPEYYPTRAERSILVSRAAHIAQLTGAAEVVELGSGTAEKTRVLLAALRTAGTLHRYVPLDVTQAMIERCARELTELDAGLHVHGIVGDFERHLEHVPPPAGGPRIVAFLGGTIGNFTPGARRRFLRRVRRLLRPGVDHLLLGTDLVKDTGVLEAAYNDSAGVTAEFNRNVLHVINRELGADFDVELFEHVAFFDAEREWIEMRLRSTVRQQVTIPAVGLELEFAPREELRTEISAKFTLERLETDLGAAGLVLERVLTDDAGLFALSLSTPRT
jgi:L-histidine N-alpha-methyltransferase